MEKRNREKPCNQFMAYKLDNETKEAFEKLCEKKKVGKCTMARLLVENYVEQNRDLIKQ